MVKNKSIPLFILFVSLVLMPIVSSASSPAVYTPGDTVSLRFPETGTVITAVSEPEFVRWTVKNPSGHIVYEVDNPVAYKSEIFYFVWSIYDVHYFTVPGFAQAGVWKAEGRLFSKLWIIDDPGIIPAKYEFTVAETSFFQSLFSPFYITHDMGFLLGRISFRLPCHWSIIVLVAVVMIILFILMLRMRKR